MSDAIELTREQFDKLINHSVVKAGYQYFLAEAVPTHSDNINYIGIKFAGVEFIVK